MKIAGKIALFAGSLCVITATVIAALYQAHRNRAPGPFGSNLEFRVSAFNAVYINQSPVPAGYDVFEDYQARQFSESGAAPAGFMWLPVWQPFAAETSGNLGLRSITRVSGGREYLLVATRPEMTITHAPNVPAWGVKSVQLEISTKFGRPFPYVKIVLDSSGQRLLRQFTQKYRGHSITMIVNGQVCSNATFLTPLSKGILGISFPPGWQAQAQKLRDALLSGKG